MIDAADQARGCMTDLDVAEIESRRQAIVPKAILDARCQMAAIRDENYPQRGRQPVAMEPHARLPVGLAKRPAGSYRCSNQCE